MEAEMDLKDALNNDFLALNERNRKNILEMTRFLVITQEKIVPSMLNEGAMLADAPIPLMEGEKQGLA
jgi:hypothetical protein